MCQAPGSVFKHYRLWEGIEGVRISLLLLLFRGNLVVVVVVLRQDLTLYLWPA